jgi:hypothetical protein
LRAPNMLPTGIMRNSCNTEANKIIASGW